MRKEISREVLLDLIKGNVRVKKGKVKYIKLYAIVDECLIFLTLLRVKNDGRVKIMENPIRTKWFKYDKYMLVGTKTTPLWGV